MYSSRMPKHQMEAAEMSKSESKKHFAQLAKMPREAPITQGPDELGPRNELRARILSMRLFPNLYNSKFLLGQ
jgi:hypothetical protein